MALILSIETGTDICSVALANDGELMALRESDEGRDHAKKVALFVDELLRETGVQPSDLDAIAVGKGPGSYTGLRIGVSFAKGLCYALNIPLIAVGSLNALTEVAREDYDAGILDIEEEDWSKARLCPMVDARRMEVYAAVYNESLEAVMPVGAYIVDENTFSEILSQRKVIFCGNGAAKCREVINHPNAIFVDGVYPLATGMLALAERAFVRQQFSDVAYYEPFYLKEFVATTPKNKVF